LDEGNDLTTITGSLNIETSASVSYLEVTGSSSDLNRIQVANGGGLYSKLVTNERSSVRLIDYSTGNITRVGGNQELTLGGATIVNELANAVDFRVESGDNTHAIFLDDSADAVGLFTANPTSELTVEGDVSASGNFITTATGSFGALIGDGSQLTNVSATPDATLVSGSFQGGGSTNISGSILSTGSFGRVHTPGTIKSDSRIEIGSNCNFLTTQLKVGDGTRDIRLNANHGSEAVVGTVGAHDFHIITGNAIRFQVSGSNGQIKSSGSIVPYNDDDVNLGSSALSWSDVFAVQTTVGAVFETGLRSEGIGKEETGTIVVWRNGGLVPCDKSEDTMVMGVIKEGKDEPIVMGAEPVLVTGDVKEGDFITTSTKQGHGKKLENGYLLKKEMFGKVIAQALEDSSGESSLIKCMIRKM